MIRIMKSNIDLLKAFLQYRGIEYYDSDLDKLSNCLHHVKHANNVLPAYVDRPFVDLVVSRTKLNKSTIKNTISNLQRMAVSVNSLITMQGVCYPENILNIIDKDRLVFNNNNINYLNNIIEVECSKQKLKIFKDVFMYRLDISDICDKYGWSPMRLCNSMVLALNSIVKKHNNNVRFGKMYNTERVHTYLCL